MRTCAIPGCLVLKASVVIQPHLYRIILQCIDKKAISPVLKHWLYTLTCGRSVVVAAAFDDVNVA